MDKQGACAIIMITHKNLILQHCFYGPNQNPCQLSKPCYIIISRAKWMGKGVSVGVQKMSWAIWNDLSYKEVEVCFYASILLIWASSWQNQQRECAPSEDSDQPGHPPSLIRVFAVRMKKAWTLSCPLSAQQRLWSDWADAQADLSLHWAHSHIVCFVTRRLIYHTSEAVSL